ncbi:hypothetical protein HU200_045065 [Digitaria exilis]|uniref:non-specific serine/threonine protein kinase n=1 Tax=Digitaria exilis TaxID=1010633 RepID=A0A835B0M4_9POAL|nr:hypothetical protein HU200_045065 [Digitaria exilis]
MVPKVLVGLIAAAICAAILIVIPVLVYLGRKLSRSCTHLPLAPAAIESIDTTAEPTSSNESPARNNNGKNTPSYEPPITNLATFQRADQRKALVYDDILKATGKFNDKHIIGHGGFGTVYGATVPGHHGRRVAIKRLHRSSCRFLRSNRQLAAEMDAILQVKHQNLVPLLGYCLVGDERLLIYARVRNGSLDAWLRRTNHQAATTSSSSSSRPLIGWVDRLEICLGSARGLAFLHHGFAPSNVVTHGDVKSSNILLDEHMRPRVSDLGLAKVITRYETHVKTSVSGALEGYVPPEYPLKMKCTAKGDVYSFGVVMLEVLTGRPAAGQEKEQGGGNLVGWVRWMVAHGREGGELFDPCLLLPEEDEDEDEAAADRVGRRDQQMARVLAVAMECTADEPWKRPAMGSVVEELMRIQLMVYNEPHQSPIRGVVET